MATTTNEAGAGAGAGARKTRFLLTAALELALALEEKNNRHKDDDGREERGGPNASTSTSMAEADIAAHLGKRLLKLRAAEGDARKQVGSLRAGVRASFGGSHGPGGGGVSGVKMSEWRQLCAGCGIPETASTPHTVRRVRISSILGRRGKRAKGRRMLCLRSVCTRCGHSTLTKLRNAAGKLSRRNCIMRDMRAAEAARRLVNDSNDPAPQRKRQRGSCAVVVEGRRQLS